MRLFSLANRIIRVPRMGAPVPMGGLFLDCRGYVPGGEFIPVSRVCQYRAIKFWICRLED